MTSHEGHKSCHDVSVWEWTHWSHWWLAVLNVCRFCTFGIFSLVVCWIATAAHLGISLVCSLSACLSLSLCLSVCLLLSASEWMMPQSCYSAQHTQLWLTNVFDYRTLKTDSCMRLSHSVDHGGWLIALCALWSLIASDTSNQNNLKLFL